jgi:hypothetical protein
MASTGRKESGTKWWKEDWEERMAREVGERVGARMEW